MSLPNYNDEAGLAGMKSAAMPVDAKSGEILQSIYDRCERRGLHLAFFSKAMVDIISMNTRVTESGNNFRFTGTGNSILDPPESVGDILACCLALDAKKQLINLLGKYGLPQVTNPPGFIKNENGTDKYAATTAEIRNVSTPGDPGTSIFLPRRFVKSDIVNYKIVEKCGNDLIIYIIRDGDVIGFANVCFTFFSDDFFQPEKGIFWNFFGVKNPTLGEPQRGDRVTGREILELLEDLFRLLRFTRECVPREVPIPGYENVFDSKEIDKLAGCAAGPPALRFWENNSYIQISKEEAKAAGWTDEEIDDPNIFPVEKRLDKIEEAKAAVLGEKSAAAVEEESVFSAAETQSMINARSQSKGTPIQPETSSQFPSRFKRPGSSRRSSLASSLASNAPPTQGFLFQSRVVNPIRPVRRLEHEANANPFGAGGGAMRFNPQQQVDLIPDDVDSQIERDLEHVKRFGGILSQQDKDAMKEELGFSPIAGNGNDDDTYDSDEERRRLSELPQGMVKSSSNLMAGFTDSIPSAGKVKASKTFSNSNSNVFSNQSKQPGSNIPPYYEKFATPLQQNMFKQHLAYADMLDNKPIEKNDYKSDDDDDQISNKVEHNVDKEIKEYIKAEREKELVRKQNFGDGPITKRSRQGGRKTKVKTKTNKKSVTKKRNPRQTKRRRQRRNTRQTKRRHK